jgi:hypothetical protein
VKGFAAIRMLRSDPEARPRSHMRVSLGERADRFRHDLLDTGRQSQEIFVKVVRLFAQYSAWHYLRPSRLGRRTFAGELFCLVVSTWHG